MVKIVMKNASLIRRSFAIPARCCKLPKSTISGQEPESRFFCFQRRTSRNKQARRRLRLGYAMRARDSPAKLIATLQIMTIEEVMEVEVLWNPSDRALVAKSVVSLVLILRGSCVRT
jgi:hypothetical protein